MYVAALAVPEGSRDLAPSFRALDPMRRLTTSPRLDPGATPEDHGSTPQRRVPTPG